MAKYKRTKPMNFNTSEGLEINSIMEHYVVSRYRHRMCVWDDDHIVLENPNGKGFLRVGINKKIRKYNGQRANNTNAYVDKLNGR